MKRLNITAAGYVAALVTLAMPGVSQAAEVDFSTTGAFYVNGVQQSLAFLSFTGLTTTVNTPSNTGLGNFQTGNNGLPQTIPDNTTFTLTVSQTVPSTGTNSDSATITGTLQSADQSSIKISFDAQSQNFTIGAVTYELDPFYRIVPPDPSNNNGVTSLQGFIEFNPNILTSVPEPGAMMLLGCGLIGLGALSKVRRK